MGHRVVQSRHPLYVNKARGYPLHNDGWYLVRESPSLVDLIDPNHYENPSDTGPFM